METEVRLVDTALSFYGIIGSAYELAYSIDRYFIASKNSNSLKSLAITYKQSCIALKEKYDELIESLRKNMPAKIWDDNLAGTDKKMSDQINQLIEKFSDAARNGLDEKDVPLFIMELKLLVYTIKLKLSSLWILTIASIMALIGNITTLNTISRFYQSIESLIYALRAVSSSIEVNESGSLYEGKFSIYILALQQFRTEYDELIESLKNMPAKIWDDNLAGTDKKMSSQISQLIDLTIDTVKASPLEKIKSILDEVALNFIVLWRQIFSHAFTQSRVSTYELSKQLSPLNPSEGKSNDPDFILQILSSISSSGSEMATIYSRFHEYTKAIKEYELVQSAYDTSLAIVKSNDNLQNLSITFRTANEYWKQRGVDCLSEGRLYESSEIAKYSAQGDELMKQGLYLESILAYDKAMERKYIEDTTDLLDKKGKALFKLNLFSHAFEIYTNLTKLKPRSLEAWNGLGLSLMQLKRYDEAENSFDTAKEIDKRNYVAWYGKGVCFYFLKRYDEAENSFDTAKEINPNDATLWYNKGLLFYRVKRYKDALNSYEMAEKLKPDYLWSKANRAEILLIIDKYDESQNLAEQIREASGGENYEFAMSFLIICCLYLRAKVTEGTQAVLDLLDYYESFSNKPATNDISLTVWNFDGSQEKINAVSDSILAAKDKKLLNSLISLPKKNIDERIEAVNEIRNLILQPVQKQRSRLRQYLTLGRNLGQVGEKKALTESDIKIVNTSSSINDKKGWYNWEIYLDAPKSVLSSIDDVEYNLHPSFKDPIRRINDPKNGFVLKSNGWGEFKVKVKIKLKNGETITKYHWLNLSDQS
jgi:tetratricopeptide (TPR) repeat protein